MFAGVFDEFVGVPTHPLAVHAPVVLIPIATVVAVVLSVRDDLRRRVGWFMPGAVLVLVVMLFVAKESGEAAKEADNIFGDIAQHEDLANATFVLSLVWFVLALAVTIRDRMVGRGRAQAVSADALLPSGDRIAFVLGVLAAIAAIVTTVWLIRTGHAGAESRWKLA